jgi:hypothetical protein
MLPDETVRKLALGDGSVYHFDMSAISSEFYEPLLRTLQRFAQQKVDSLGFSCDELARAEERALTGKPIPVSVLNSIAKTKASFLRNLVELLCYVVSRSTRILEIVLSNLAFQRDHLTRVLTALSRSTSLRIVHFARIRLGDEGVLILLRGLNPNQIETISLAGCGVSHASLGEILAFIGRKDPLLPKSGGIRTIVVSMPSLSEPDQQAINDALGIGTPSRETRKKIEADEIQREIAELANLEKENRELKITLTRLCQSVSAIEFKEDVFIVGKGAPEFAEFLAEIEKKVYQPESRP